MSLALSTSRSSKFDLNELEGYKKGIYFQLRYGWVKAKFWIESGFDIDGGGFSIDGYGFTFSPNKVLINFDEELEKVMRRITNWNKKVQTNQCDIGDDVCFSLDIEENLLICFTYISPSDSEYCNDLTSTDLYDYIKLDCAEFMSNSNLLLMKDLNAYLPRGVTDFIEGDIMDDHVPLPVVCLST